MHDIINSDVTKKIYRHSGQYRNNRQSGNMRRILHYRNTAMVAESVSDDALHK